MLPYRQPGAYEPVPLPDHVNRQIRANFNSLHTPAKCDRWPGFVEAEMMSHSLFIDCFLMRYRTLS
jgi:hypothetical protein